MILSPEVIKKLRNKIAHRIAHDCMPAVYNKDEAKWYYSIADEIILIIQEEIK